MNKLAGITKGMDDDRKKEIKRGISRKDSTLVHAENES